MNKGYIKLYRSEEDIPKLWQSALLFSTYQKLKILADSADWAVTVPVRKLAVKMGMSVDTLRKATAELAQIGLIRVAQTPEGVSRYELVFADAEPDLSQVSTAAPSKAKAVPERTKTETVAVPNSSTRFVLNSSTKNPAPVLNYSTTPVLNFRTPLYREQEIVLNNKTTTPLLFPQSEQENDFMASFAAFWTAYPNKKSKQRALKRWKKGNYKLSEILPALNQQKRLRDWVKHGGQYVPRADAYLNQRRWEDELPKGEEAYILDFKAPKTARDKAAKDWLDGINPQLLQNDNQKINCVFEVDRIYFEKIISHCGGNVAQAFNVMRHGWRCGCFTLRAIADRAAAYLDELRSKNEHR